MHGASRLRQISQADSNSLGNVSCVSTTFCMAIGAYSGQNGESETLAESWNGTAWSVVTTPIQAINRLSNLTCVSDVLCTAVGSYQLSADVSQTLIEMWNGTAWSIVSSPNVGTDSDSLSGVACTSDTSCMAVGSWTNSSTNVVNTLAEVWNERVAVDRAKSGFLRGRVQRVRRRELPVESVQCTAVGLFHYVADQTLIESWNGTAWSIVPSPNGAGGENSSLGIISCSSADFCMAMGIYGVDGNTPSSRGTVRNGPSSLRWVASSTRFGAARAVGV